MEWRGRRLAAGRRPICECRQMSLRVGLVNQRGGLQSRPRLFAGHTGCSQAAQFIIDKRQNLLGRRGISLVDLREDGGYVGHG